MSWSVSTRLFGLLRDIPRRKCRPLAEEEVFHVLRHEFLRLFLPRHEPVLVEDHLHPILPALPGIHRHVLVDALAEFPGPRRGVETGQFLLELHTEHLPAALVARGSGRGCGARAISHGRIVTPAIRARCRTPDVRARSAPPRRPPPVRAHARR